MERNPWGAEITKIHGWMAATRFYHRLLFHPPLSLPLKRLFFAFAVVEWLTRLLCVLPGWDNYP